MPKLTIDEFVGIYAPCAPCAPEGTEGTEGTEGISNRLAALPLLCAGIALPREADASCRL